MSQLRVASVANAGGTNVLVNGYPTQPGQIIEYLTSLCDGSTVNGLSGSYTWPNVTAAQDFNSTYTTITGSQIAYTPPPGTSKVIYKFDFTYRWGVEQSHSIQHYKFFIDGVEVLHSRHSKSAAYLENRSTFEWSIPVGGTANTNTGRQATWTSPKTLLLQARRYATSSHGGVIHQSFYWDGGGTTQFSLPSLSIIAIA
jgi:hypothetical protein